MFGYVRAFKPELRIKEFELYKAVYCSLCKQIGKQYGLVSRFSLSYDFTFLALLNLSLRDGCVQTARQRCVCNPAKHCNYLVSDGDCLAFPAAASQVMLYYKLSDNIQDEGFLKATVYRLLRMFSKRGFQRAVRQFPQLETVFTEYINRQNALEHENVQDIDAAADPTAQMLSRLFALCAPDDEIRALTRMGYCMGRWIYLADAAADYEADCRHGQYNPLKSTLAGANNSTAALRERLDAPMRMCVSEAAAAFELLNIYRFKNILGNVLYLGLENCQNNIFEKEKHKA